MNEKQLSIGIIREGKTPPDSRVPLTPEQCAFLISEKNIDIVVQSSSNRCFPDEAYHQAGISVVEDISNCDILMGVKEVPINQLISDKVEEVPITENSFVDNTKFCTEYPSISFHNLFTFLESSVQL